LLSDKSLGLFSKKRDKQPQATIKARNSKCMFFSVQDPRLLTQRALEISLRDLTRRDAWNRLLLYASERAKYKEKCYKSKIKRIKYF